MKKDVSTSNTILPLFEPSIRTGSNKLNNRQSLFSNRLHSDHNLLDQDPSILVSRESRSCPSSGLSLEANKEFLKRNTKMTSSPDQRDDCVKQYKPETKARESNSPPKPTISSKEEIQQYDLAMLASLVEPPTIVIHLCNVFLETIDPEATKQRSPKVQGLDWDTTRAELLRVDILQKLERFSFLEATYEQRTVIQRLICNADLRTLVEQSRRFRVNDPVVKLFNWCNAQCAVWRGKWKSEASSPTHSDSTKRVPWIKNSTVCPGPSRNEIQNPTNPVLMQANLTVEVESPSPQATRQSYKSVLTTLNFSSQNSLSLESLQSSEGNSYSSYDNETTSSIDLFTDRSASTDCSSGVNSTMTSSRRPSFKEGWQPKNKWLGDQSFGGSVKSFNASIKLKSLQLENVPSKHIPDTSSLNAFLPPHIQTKAHTTNKLPALKCDDINVSRRIRKMADDDSKTAGELRSIDQPLFSRVSHFRGEIRRHCADSGDL